MPFKFGTLSLAELATVHPLLQKMAPVALAKSPVDFAILQGIRSSSEQLKAFLSGNSRIDPRKRPGRHQVGCAVDFIVIDPKTKKPTYGEGQGAAYKKKVQSYYADVRAAFYAASKELKIPIRTLESIGDLGHVELPKASVPDNWKSKK